MSFRLLAGVVKQQVCGRVVAVTVLAVLLLLLSCTQHCRATHLQSRPQRPPLPALQVCRLQHKMCMQCQDHCVCSQYTHLPLLSGSNLLIMANIAGWSSWKPAANPTASSSKNFAVDTEG
jgi:hypothetical protein